MPVPDFSPGEVLTAAAMDSIGLWKITTVTFAASSVAIDNCFTTNYANYVIIANVTTGAGGAAQVQMSMRAGGVTNSTTNYYSFYNGIQWGGTVNNAGNVAGTNWFALRTNGDNAGFSGVVEMQNPNLASRTRFQSHGADQAQRWYAGGLHDSTTQFDGFVLANSGGNSMTGTVRVYGYRD
jgi:hypothetical protein